MSAPLPPAPGDGPVRARLDPAQARVRLAVRETVERYRDGGGSAVLVALSGGADSLALASATAHVAPRLGVAAGALVVDHGLQPGSTGVAERAAEAARALGLDPVRVLTVRPGSEGGPEAAARAARYAALEREAEGLGAALLLGHTLDDQAETVLLGLARGSGARSLSGMAAADGLRLRPLLGVTREQTRRLCRVERLPVWDDPHNTDPSYARVRVRSTVLPVLEDALGPGVAAALARTAAQLREDADALDALAAEALDGLAERDGDLVALSVPGLAALPAALRNRVVRAAVHGDGGRSLSRRHTLEIVALVTDWHGQGPIDVPGVAVSRSGDRLLLHPAVRR
ncbi:tRNA lysidine(34) synthetase TilS [Mycetocola reblochoni]|uniref:tRNA(Ile)-lysidine synthase n=2 Tax=Mycetocola reblochoni TaxID=331618 RepID=A0A1R4I7P0_9MICO|nr:tRNA lysidine(34) synthetase TilS [Mycetocola reblochoni]RLP68922.1 tRNA lysidine(34) synthetase TilS [Mycetocola reblochoni]SJN15769.1 tRNA(Ile)-lysidine synthetase [Mycetocola reblochoni REB411]